MVNCNKDFLRNRRALVGFDGYIDRILRPIAQTTEETAAYFDTIGDFGNFLAGKTGKSCAIQLDSLEERRGGNAPILAGTLAGIGAQVTLCGMLGRSGPLAVFDDLPENCARRSYAAPWETLALEFLDGKVMLAPRQPAPENPLVAVEQALGGEAAAGEAFGADLVAMVNWGEIDFMHSLWRAAAQKYICTVPQREKQLFFDLADPARHPAARVNELMELIGACGRYRTTVLSVNLNEAQLIAEKLGISCPDPREAGGVLAEQFGIDQVAVHTLHESLLFENGRQYAAPTSFVPKPKISTGAGDNFNAGYCAALLLGLSPDERLRAANASANYYVRNARGIPFETFCAALNQT